MTPAALINLSNPTPTTDKEVGSYQLTKGLTGKMAAERAPIFRAIPTTREHPRDTRKQLQLKKLPSQEWNQVNTAKKSVLENPFVKKQSYERIFKLF